jgi:cytochrome P450
MRDDAGRLREIDDSLLSPEFVSDPYPTLDALRELDPVHWSESIGGWVLTRYDDILRTFKDVEHYSNEERLGRATPHLAADARQQLESFEAHYRTTGLLHSDPPDDTRLRRLIRRAFAPRVIESMRPRIQHIVDDLIDQVEVAGEMEVIEDLAFALTVTVMADLLGVPKSHGATFRQWADRLPALQGINTPTAEVLLAAQGALIQAREYLAKLIAERRCAPGDDLISHMLGVSDDGESLSDAEIHPHRCDGPDRGTRDDHLPDRRRVADSAEPPRATGAAQGRPVVGEAGDRTDTSVRKPGVTAAPFTQARRRTWWTRPRARADGVPDAFGQGIHFCIGAPLSRIEGETVFRAVLKRLPAVRLIDAHPSWDLEKANSRVLRSLPVAF